MDRMAILSKERISEELLKGLSGSNPRRYFEILEATNALYSVFPEFNGCTSMHHDNRGHHHFESIAEHTAEALGRTAVVGLKPDPVLRLAVMLHDVGKLYTRDVKDGRIRFIMHDSVGADLMKTRLRSLRFSEEIVSRVTTIIAFHMRMHEIARHGSTRREVAALFVDLNESMKSIYDLCIVAEKDSGEVGECMDIMILAEEFATIPRAITGEDVMHLEPKLRGPLLARLRLLQLQQSKIKQELLRENFESELRNVKRWAAQKSLNKKELKVTP